VQRHPGAVGSEPAGRFGDEHQAGVQGSIFPAEDSAALGEPAAATACLRPSA
jgi:hypothetical protein